MAEEEIQESSTAGSPPKKKKSSMMMIIIVVLAAALAGGAGYFFYGRTVMAGHASSAARGADSRDDRRDDKRDDRRDDRRSEARAEVGPIVSLEPFVMNVSGNASRFVKMAVAIEVRNEKVTEEVKKITPAIRDAMLGVLGAKPPEAFMDVTGRGAIKKELFDSVDGLFKRGDLQAVYITDIIMQ